MFKQNNQLDGLPGPAPSECPPAPARLGPFCFFVARCHKKQKGETPVVKQLGPPCCPCPTFVRLPVRAESGPPLEVGPKNF